MRRIMFGMVIATCVAFGGVRIVQGVRLERQATSVSEADPVTFWSTEARRAIVPPGKDGIFGRENYGNKFPGEAAIYLGIVHAAVYDAALAFGGGYQPYAIAVTAAADASPEAAVATAAHHVLVGLLQGVEPATPLDVINQAYLNYLDAIDDVAAKESGKLIGEQVANAVLALRVNDGRKAHPVLTALDPPAPGAGVWDPGSTEAVGLRVPGIRP